ncbi:DUF2076 family protein [Cupriavidus campinensis]|uniref:DUF2076 family protein n=1 Tax=Cupriavidus campinensis TaxID=151783 RepID=A0ABY3ET23_9BURK|nr:DUF2076 family protein [Cupriavidus campinensis]TSP13718.1 DUF2076 family protein [Cupriavidus campinensis]
MTPQDTQALDNFLTQLTQARAQGKDPQAAAMIADAVARQPDAAYLLVQRAMLLDHALADARAQIAGLQQQLQQLQQGQAAQGYGARGFADGDVAWGNSVGRGVAPVAPMQPAPAAPMQPAPPARGGFLSGGFGSALGSIATTAAGVAGGAFLFQGIEHLFNGGGSGAGNSGNGFLGGQPSETVVNNYFDDGQGFGSGTADSGNLDAGLDDYLDDSSQV